MRQKYHAIRTTVDDIIFDSKHEATRYCELKLLEKAKVISELKLQVPFVLIDKSKYGREIRYIADFVYYEDGKLVIEDTKSKATITPIYKLKKRLMAERYGYEIRETL